jgi:hypothetical protein
MYPRIFWPGWHLYLVAARNTLPPARTIKTSICPQRFYIVTPQCYVGKHQSNMVYIARDLNLGTYLWCNS